MDANPKHLAGALLLVLLASVALSLNGCDDAPRTQRIYSAPHGSRPPLLTAAMENKAVQVHAVGSISDPPRDIAAQYARWLQDQDEFLHFEIGDTEIPAPGNQPWILILHNTPTGYTGISGCQGIGYEPEENPTEVVFRTVVCGESGRLVEILGVVPREEVDDIDAAYRALLHDTVRQMITEEEQGDR